MGNYFQILTFSGLYAILNTFGAAIIKSELKKYELLKIQDYLLFLFRYKVIFSFFIILISALMMFKALSLGKFSIISPIATGINFLLTISIGYFFFKDVLTIIHFVGILLICSGIFMISFAEAK
jgi:uncharacterized membrane protein